MTQGDGPVVANAFRDFSTTLVTVSTIQGAFDGDNVFTSFIHLYVQNFDIW
jgi:hypothetical protein